MFTIFLWYLLKKQNFHLTLLTFLVLTQEK